MNRKDPKDPAWAVLGGDFNDTLFDMAREDDYVGIYREVSRLLGYGWQPIHTAPKDGSLVLLGSTDPDFPMRCRRWVDNHWRGWDGDEATTWHKLPEDPA